MLQTGACYLNVSLQLLIVDVDGVLAAVIRASPEQTVGHLDVQQVVQHLHLGLEEQMENLGLGTRVRETHLGSAEKTHTRVTEQKVQARPPSWWGTVCHPPAGL